VDRLFYRDCSIYVDNESIPFISSSLVRRTRLQKGRLECIQPAFLILASKKKGEIPGSVAPPPEKNAVIGRGFPDN